MRDDTQFTQEERYQIEALLKMGHHQSEIAVVLKRHKSTISREVRRNRGLRGYRPKQAQHLALARCEAKAKPRIAPGTWEWVESLLREEWSPEQVSRLASEEQGLHVSHEWIYSMFMQTSARAATFIPTGVARSGAGSTTGAMSAGPDQGSGCNRRAAGDC
jgi:IS30 family transposase